MRCRVCVSREGLLDEGGGVVGREERLKGEKEGEDGALVGGALATAEEEAALMAVDDFVADPEAEAGAAEAFGGEEGFEDAGAGLGRHADASVGDGEDQAAAVGAPVGGLAAAHQEAATGGHCIDGVGDEIVEDLADVAFEAGDWVGGAFAPVDGDGGVAETAFVEAEDGGEEFVAVDLTG